jgi:adenylate cyclase
MGISASASQGLSTDAFSQLRHGIDGPLHQVVACAGMIKDAAKKEQTVIACRATLVCACESMLHLFEVLDNAGEDAFSNRWLSQFRYFSAAITAAASELQHINQGRDDSQLCKDGPAIAAAAQAIAEAVRRYDQELPAPRTALKQSTGTAKPVPDGMHPRSTHNGKNGEHETGKSLVLVVDDNEANRDVLARRLQRDGCDVRLASGGYEALEIADHNNVDLVLLDIMMPDMDGFAVLKEFKQTAKLKHIPIIMITAVDEIESVVRCIEMGADDYLMKPFNPVLLRARVNALLERKRLRDDEIRMAKGLEQALFAIDRQTKKTQELLLNILPASVAEELQQNGVVEPMYFEDVTVVFADFVGFTLSTEELPADELVSALHEYFTAFDQIVGRYGLEKLKTIGDCYMYAGGIPQRNPSHPVDCILAAMEMVKITEQLSSSTQVPWQVRIGMNTGPVIAGVVGIHKFAFDIWGDTVNFSSRMETASAPNRINVSANTFLRVKDFFACEKRGRLQIKEKREVEMYFVNGIAPGLLKKAGTLPAAFARRYRTYFRKELPIFPSFLADSGLQTHQENTENP